MTPRIERKKTIAKEKRKKPCTVRRLQMNFFSAKNNVIAQRRKKKITGKCFTNLLFKKEASTHLQNNEGTQVWTNTDMLIQSLSNRRR